MIRMMPTHRQLSPKMWSSFMRRFEIGVVMRFSSSPEARSSSYSLGRSCLSSESEV